MVSTTPKPFSSLNNGSSTVWTTNFGEIKPGMYYTTVASSFGGGTTGTGGIFGNWRPFQPIRNFVSDVMSNAIENTSNVLQNTGNLASNVIQTTANVLQNTSNFATGVLQNTGNFLWSIPNWIGSVFQNIINFLVPMTG